MEREYRDCFLKRVCWDPVKRKNGDYNFYSENRYVAATVRKNVPARPSLKADFIKQLLKT